MAAESAPGIPVELFGLVTPLSADGGPVPGEIEEPIDARLGPHATWLSGPDQSNLEQARHSS